MKKHEGMRLTEGLTEKALKKWKKEKSISQHKGIAALVEHLLEKYLKL